jgi:hypothetical protein
MDRTLNVLCSSNLSVSELSHAPSPLNSQLKSFFAKYFSHKAYFFVTKNSFPPFLPHSRTPWESLAAAGAAQPNRELVADESAATAGEDRRATGAACAVLLAATRRGASEPAAIWSHAGPDRTATATVGIVTCWPGQPARNLSTEGCGEERCCKSELESGAIPPGRRMRYVFEIGRVPPYR